MTGGQSVSIRFAGNMGQALQVGSDEESEDEDDIYTAAGQADDNSAAIDDVEEGAGEHRLSTRWVSRSVAILWTRTLTHTTTSRMQSVPRGSMFIVSL